MPHTTPLPLTGERTVPNLPTENYWFRRHEAAYEWVAHTLRINRFTTIVDAGSGEGYGIRFLAQHSPNALAVGLELEWASTRHAARSYHDDAYFVAANLDMLPLRDASIDLLVSMQVVEHLWDLPQFLRESVRVLTPGARAVFTTPNRLTFSPGLTRGERPTNPFHVEEFDADQLRQLIIAAGFSDVQVWGLTHNTRVSDWELAHEPLVRAQVAAVIGQVSWPDHLVEFVSSVTTDDFVVAPTDVNRSLDLIVLATKGELP